MKKLNGNSYILIALMVITLVMIAVAPGFEYFATKLIPMVVGSLVFILSAVQLWREITGKVKAETTVAEDAISIGGESGNGGRRYLPIAAWIAGYALAIALVGFIPSILLFVLLYMKLHGSRWFTAIILSVLFTGIMYTVFEYALELPFYQGFLFTY